MDRFFLVDNQRVSVRSWIAREIVSNILVHREYSKGYLAKIIIESDRNLYKFAKIYSGGIPELVEGDVFKTTVPLKGIGAIGFIGDGISDDAAIPNSITNAIPNAITNSETRQKIISLVQATPSITAKVMAEEIGIAERNVKTHIKALKDAGVLLRVGGTRGHWEIAADLGDRE